MWFKNLIVYGFNGPVHFAASELEDFLRLKPLRPCGKLELMTMGWLPPIPEGTAFVHETNDCILFSMGQEERLLPSSIILKEVNEKILDIQKKQDRKVFSKEKETIKKDVIVKLLPQAFVQPKRIYGYIDKKMGWLIINTASFSTAEKVIQLLRNSIGSLPIRLLETNQSLSSFMTLCMKQAEELPEKFAFGDECEFITEQEGKGIIRCKNQELNTEEVLLHLESGKVVNEMGIEWNQSLRAVLCSHFVIKRLKFFDAIKDLSENDYKEDANLQFDSDFTLMVLTLREFIKDIIDCCQGVKNFNIQEKNDHSVLSSYEQSVAQSVDVNKNEVETEAVV